MKLFKIMMFFLVAAFMRFNAAGQANASINVLTQNSGIVGLGGTVFIQVDVGNTGPTSSIGVNKVRAQISIPIAIAHALPNAQQTGLPAGWTIVTNTGGAIQVCNGTDVIPVNAVRTVLIAVQGDALGGPSTVTGVLSFGPGTGVCTGPGSLPGDITADNTSSSTIQVIPAPACNLSVSALAGSISCNGGTTTLTATPSGAAGAVEYSITGGAPFQAGNTFTVNAGTYTITARETGNTTCSATSSAIIISQPAALNATANSTAVTTPGGSDGTATAGVTGGTSPYTYVWAPGGQTTATASGLAAGSYTVTVTDAKGCSTTATTTVTAPTCNVSASAIAGAAITCNGGTTSLTVTATGATAPVQYSLNGGAFQASNVFTVGAGSYTVSVKDANNCTATTNTVTIAQPTAVVVSANAPAIALPGGTTTVTVGATGGTAPYTGTGTFVRSAGTYTFTVTDANGCTGVATATLTDPTPGNANASINILTLNSGQVNQGEIVDVQVSVGNTGPSFIGNNKVRAQISIPAAIATALPTAQQTGLPSGWTIVSNTGGVITICNGTDFIPAGTQRQILIKVQGVAAGGPSTITGVLSFGPGTGVCTGPGSLPGDITADNTSTSTIRVISTCNLNASAIAGTIACNGGTTTLTVSTTGGTSPLQFSLNGGAFQADSVFIVNAAGSPYTVSVKDANNCTATTTAVIVTQPLAISATAAAGTIACNGGTTILTVTATGGTGSLQYSLNGGAFQAGNTFGVNAAGSPYTVTVKDANACTATTSAVTVTQPAALTATATSTPVTTIGGTDGTATANAVGGTSPYTYVWAPGGQTTVTASGLAAGSYTVTITDAKGCTTTATATVGSPACNVSASAIAGAAITCNGGTTSLTVTATGAAAPVQYSLNGGAFQASNVFTVGAGSYTVSVKDANNCTATTNTVTIAQPTAVVVSANAPAIALPGGTTTVTVGATGGTAPYTGTGTFVRSAGTYTFTVTDANGCTGVATASLTDPTPGNANASINILTLNSGQVNQGEVVDVQVSVGNTGPSFIGNNKVRAQISIPIAIATALPTAQQTGLPSGWTIVSNTGGVITICNGTDFIPAGTQRQILIKVQGVAAGGPSTITGVLSFGPGTGVCTGPGSLPGDITADNTSTSTIKVISTCNLNASAIAGTIACNGGTTTLTVSTTGGASPLQFSLNGGAFQADSVFTVNAAGSPYTVNVKDAGGCTATTSAVTVTQPTALTAAASSTPVSTSGGTDGTATVTAAGGTAPYTYLWTPSGQTTATATGLTAGAYSVTVTDSKGCTAIATTSVGSPACNISATASAGTIACAGAMTTLTVTVTGGAAPLQYSLNGGAFQSANTFTVGAGSYTVTVKDANQCTATTNTVVITVIADVINPTITAPATVSVCTNTGCTATGVMLGTPVTADNCTVASVTNNAPGAFPLGTTTVTWTVTDASGNTATATQTVTVADHTAPVIALNQTGLSLPGTTGPSSSSSPYVLPVVPGVKFTSILSAGDNIGGYQMAGVPDGMGAFDNCDGTFTLLMNHEILNTLGSVRAHGGKGAFVSKWIIDKSDLHVVSGSDLMQQVYMWNTTTQVSDATATTGFAFHRFCSGDLPSVSAYYNAATGLGTQARIYMHGEEGATGFQMGSVASGPDAGKSYVLGKFDLANNGSGINAVGNWENALANPFAQDKTIVIANSDGGTGIMTNAVAVYVGTKTNTGSEVDKAGLTNGTLSFINVTGNAAEITNAATRATNIVNGTPFTLSSTAATTFSRPEDGVWDPLNPGQYFFVTTDQLDQVADGTGAQVGRSRLWRLNFTDITNPQLGGTIDLLLNGSEGQNMLDNMTADKSGHLILLEDVGNASHNGKVWQYTVATNQLKLIAKHDPARFGDITAPAAAPYNQDEETSGVVDVSEILGAGMNLIVDQAHYTLPNPMVEGGQLLAFFNPASLPAATAQDTVRVCSGTGVVLGVPATADNCSVASVSNNAPSVFPAGTTNVAWTVTDGSGNTASATQVVIVSDLAVTAVATPVSAIGATDGTSVATVTGGTAPYSYVWTPGNQTTATISGLAAGIYTVSVTDARGCTVTVKDTVTSPACNISATATAGTIACFGGTTTITVTATGTTGAVQYSLNGGAFQSANTFTVSAGSYTVSVKDDGGCTTTATVSVTQPTQLTALATSTPVSTIGGANGTATVSPAGGTSPYNYVWTPGGQTTATATGLTAGSYSVAVTDAHGCTATAATTVGTPACSILASASAGTIACFGGTTTLTVSVTGATGAVQYSLNGGVFQAANTFTVTAGTYSVSVKDAGGCTATTATLNVFQPTSALTASASAGTIACNAGTTTLTVTASGGTGNKQYSLNSGAFQAGNTFTVGAGTYTVSVKDANGCTATTTAVTIAQPSAITTTASATVIACNGGTAVLTVTATGGTGTKQYSLNGGAFQAGNTFTVGAGTYSVTVKDANGCTKVQAGTINQPSLLVVNAVAPVIPCGTTTTTVTVTATGGTAPYTGTGSFVKAAGTWTFTVTDANGCTKSASVTIAGAIACGGPVDPTKCYKIVNRNSGKAAGVASGSFANNSIIEQLPYSNLSSQIWKFVQVEPNYYEIVNTNSGKALDILNSSTANGANVVQYTYESENSQKWSLTSVGSPWYAIKVKSTNKTMSVAGSSNANGADVEMRGTGSNANEQWSITEVGCPASKSSDLIVKEGGYGASVSQLTLAVQPNPSVNYFNLTIRSSDNTTPVNVRILDVSGKVVTEHQKAAVNSTLRISAENWAGGVYFAEVTQGAQRKVVKLIKVN